MIIYFEEVILNENISYFLHLISKIEIAIMQDAVIMCFLNKCASMVHS
jgi:hypothetical protein